MRAAESPAPLHHNTSVPGFTDSEVFCQQLQLKKYALDEVIEFGISDYGLFKILS
jgi:hypothetical protein